MPLSTFTPIALLPIRLETRFADGPDGKVLLKIRIYPDQIHVDAHDRDLTKLEGEARTKWQNGAHDLSAWRDLVGVVGAKRAAYIATLDNSPDPHTRPSAWSKPPRAKLLPDRWRVLVETQDGTPAAWEQPIEKVTQDPAVGLSPDDPGEIAPDSIKLAPELAWLAEFDTAVAAGMATTVELPAGTTGPLRVIVYGLRDRDPADEAAKLQDLLDAHHYTDGVSFLAAGTVTNHTSDEAAPWTSAQTTADDSFAIERGAAMATAGSIGGALADALGVSAQVFDHVDPGPPDVRDWAGLDGAVAAMHGALWPATLGYFLEQMLDGALLAGESVEQVRSFYVTRVRGSGPLPTLRIGRNPYGILPIVPVASWRPSVEDGLGQGMVTILTLVRMLWSNAASSAPKIRAGAGDDTITRVLSMSPVSLTYDGRSVLGASYASYLYDFLQRPLDKSWWQAQRARALTGWQAAQLPDRNSRLSRATYDGSHFAVAGPLVQATLDTNKLTNNYLRTLVESSLADIRNAAEVAGGTPLLYRIARHAAMASFLAAARRDLMRQQPDRVVLEPEMIGLSTGLQPPWTWLDEASSIGGALGDVLAPKATTALDDPAFVACWRGLAAIAELTTERLDALARDALDACSHRLDAWLTGVAWQRLAALRKGRPGIHIGAYGVIEDLVRAPPAQPETPPPGEDDGHPLVAAHDPGGYIHTPSLQHATTAALLRSGYLAHASGAGAPFAVDLRSTRVRAAREVLDGVRTGDSLGQVLGRRLERALLAATTPPLWQFLLPLRELAPAPDARFPDREVVDGYRLVKMNRPPAQLPWGTADLPALHSAEADAITTILTSVEDTLDSVGDLLVAESVHQLAQGNPARASGVLDALAQGAPPPSELAILELPNSGIGILHRVLALVPAGATIDGWARTPRASGEPALEAWCAAQLGPAGGYQIRVRYLAADGSELAATTLGLDALAIGALDLVRAALLDELAARVLDLARAEAPPGASGAATIAIDPARLAGSRSFDDVMLLGEALAGVLSRTRSAGAIDLAPTGDPLPEDYPIEAATVAELEGRSSDSLLADALAQLAADPRKGLLAAAALGVAGVVPAIDPAAWPAQVALATSALTARQAQLLALPPATSLDDRLARALQRLRILLGADLAIAPTFTPPASDLGASLADAGALLHDDGAAPAAWIGKLAGVRADLAALERALLVADAMDPGDAALGLRVAQLPFKSGERWIGRDVFGGASTPKARRGFVFHAPLGLDLTAPVAGLAIDGWSESVPYAKQTTGIAFQVEQPSAAPPQVVLLAVAPDLSQPTWTDAAVEQTVREALELAKLRLVDGDLIDTGGHYLPGLYFAINLEGDTASTDFTGGA